MVEPEPGRAKVTAPAPAEYPGSRRLRNPGRYKLFCKIRIRKFFGSENCHLMSEVLNITAQIIIFINGYFKFLSYLKHVHFKIFKI